MTEVKRNTVRTLIADAMPKIGRFEAFIPVSYTHLTLPTILRV